MSVVSEQDEAPSELNAYRLDNNFPKSLKLRPIGAGIAFNSNELFDW